MKKILCFVLLLFFVFCALSGCYMFGNPYTYNEQSYNDDWNDDDDWDDTNTVEDWDDAGSDGNYDSGYDEGYSDGFYDGYHGDEFEASCATSNSDYYDGYLVGYLEGYEDGESEAAAGSSEAGQNNNNGQNDDSSEDCEGGSCEITNHLDIKLYSAYSDHYFTMREYSGHIVCVVFWGTWCSTCMNKLDDLNDLAYEAKYNDFYIITVVMPDNYSEMSIGDFTDWFPGEAYPHMEVYFDEDAQFVEYLGIDGVPEYVVFGSGGDIIHIYDHIPTNEELLGNLTYFTDEGY